MDRAILLLDAHCGPCSEFGKQIENEGLVLSCYIGFELICDD